MKRKILAKDRGLIYRYPRTFVGIFTTAALLTFFSRPIYDIFFYDGKIDIEELRKTHKPIGFSKD